MTFFSSIKTGLADAMGTAKDAIERLKVSPGPITLSNEALNQAASKVFGDESEIKSLILAMHDGWFQATAHIRHNLAEFDATVDFEIVRFEVNKHIQVIELRQKGVLETMAQGWSNQIAVYVVKTIISSLLKKNLLHWGLKGQDGISFAGDRITVDLAKVGAKDALFVAMAERVGESARYLLPLIQGGTNKISEYIAINGVECIDGALQINVALNLSQE